MINDNSVDSEESLTIIKKGNIAFIKANGETIQNEYIYIYTYIYIYIYIHY